MQGLFGFHRLTSLPFYQIASSFHFKIKGADGAPQEFFFGAIKFGKISFFVRPHR